MIRRGVREYLRLRLRRSADIGSEVDEEIAAHVRHRAEQLIDLGMAPEQAWAEARQRFGSEEAIRELREAALRKERRMHLRDQVHGWLSDVRYSARALLRQPAMSVAVVLTLALGVSANALMFGMVDRLLLRGPRHLSEPHELFRLYVTDPPDPDVVDATASTTSLTGYAMYRIARAEPTLAGAGAYSTGETWLGTGEDSRPITLGRATWDLFPVLGVRPVLGRFFGEADDRPNAPRRVAVIEFEYWQAEYSGSEDVLGRTVLIDDQPYEIIGVAPPGFTGVQLGRVHMWVPISTVEAPVPDWPNSWDAKWLNVVARLRDGSTVASVGERMTARYLNTIRAAKPDVRHGTVDLRPLRFDRSGGEPLETAVARWAFGLALIILLIACANVANLLLARGFSRMREVGIRLALGTTRGRLLRLFMIESVLLAAAAGMAGLVLLAMAGPSVRAALVPQLASDSGLLDPRVVAFMALTILTVGLCVGIGPALQAMRQRGGLAPELLHHDHTHTRIREVLAGLQAALCVVLLIAAGLFVVSMARIARLDLGVEPERVLQFSVSWQPLPDEDTPEREAALSRRRTFFRDALDHLRARPDVEQASIGIGTPFWAAMGVPLRVPGVERVPELPGGGPYASAVSEGYFETVGTRLLRGRTFLPADRAGPQHVAIVNEVMARVLWPNEDPLTKCIVIGAPDAPCARVVGVVEEARRFELKEQPAMQYYVPHGQHTGMAGTELLVRPRGDARLGAETIRAAIHDINPDINRVFVRGLQDAIDPQVRPWRAGMMIFLAFGALALVIATLGLYSVMAYSWRTGGVSCRYAWHWARRCATTSSC